MKKLTWKPRRCEENRIVRLKGKLRRGAATCRPEFCGASTLHSRGDILTARSLPDTMPLSAGAMRSLTAKIISQGESGTTERGIPFFLIGNGTLVRMKSKLADSHGERDGTDRR